MKYIVNYTATEIVEADSPDEAIELAVEQHGEMPDGTWKIEESLDRVIVPRITLQNVWLELSEAMEETGNQMAYALTWGDYVANEWVEYFDDLAEAFLALALLSAVLNQGIDFAKIGGALRAARTFAMENSESLNGVCDECGEYHDAENDAMTIREGGE